MNETFVKIIETYGYLGVAVLICIENVFPPIPSEVVLLAAGFLTIGTALSPVPVIAAATAGALAGAMVLYGLGRVLKKERLKKLFSGKFGQILRLKPEFVDEADVWFKKYETKAVLICRCVPVLRSLISIPAGIAQMPLVPFVALTLLGSAVWNTLLVYIGVVMGDAWELCLPYLKKYEHVVIAVIVIACIVIAVWHFKSSRKNK